MSAGPDTTQTPVSRGERIAAGVLALRWLKWVFRDHGRVAAWWEAARMSLSSTLSTAYWAIQAGSLGHLTEPGSMEFAHEGSIATYACVQLAIPLLLTAALCAAIVRRASWLRTVFWFAVLGHGLVWLGSLATTGRYWHLEGLGGSQARGEPIPWHGGWLDLSGLADDSLPWMPCVAQILLAAAVLWFTRRRKGEAQVRLKNTSPSHC